LNSSDGRTRDLVSSIPGAGWDYSLSRHPYHEIERPMGPHYCVYNRRHMACCFDSISTEDSYWTLRQKAALLNTGEFPLQFEVIVDGILLRLADDRFWYAQADGDFYSWARAHALGMDVQISDPRVYVSQVQGPNALEILKAVNGGQLPEPFGYFAVARVDFAGQEVVVTRTGYTNELGWEFYTEAQHDANAIWQHLKAAGEPHGLEIFGLDAMNIRRIEAGILNAGSDFDHTTTPYDVGLGKFVDAGKADFIGKAALTTSNKISRLFGVKCATGEPLIAASVEATNVSGIVTAGAMSPYLQCGIGIVRLDQTGSVAGNMIKVGCRDGELHDAELVEMPFYDKLAEIPRGKRVDIPVRM